MNNRPRPPIPDSVKVKVALRQCRILSAKTELWMLRSGDQSRPEPMRLWLKRLLWGLSTTLLHCQPEDLRLDHDPPLRWRMFWNNPRLKPAARFSPNANSPDHLVYRTKEGHRIKTNVRGDGAQFPDRVLIKRERRREKKKARKPPSRLGGKHATIRSRPFQKGYRPLRGRPNR